MRAKSDYWWAGWVAGGLATFAVIEAMAFAEYPDYRHTLTAATRRWMGIYPTRPRRYVSSIGMVSGFTMLAVHFLAGPPSFARYPDPDQRFSELTTGNLPVSFRPDGDQVDP